MRIVADFLLHRLVLWFLQGYARRCLVDLDAPSRYNLQDTGQDQAWPSSRRRLQLKFIDEGSQLLQSLVPCEVDNGTSFRQGSRVYNLWECGEKFWEPLEVVDSVGMC